MANTAYAGETTTMAQDFGMRIGGAVKRAFAAFLESREREAQRRVKPYLTSDEIDSVRF